jgi:disulfide bond formation protein DsbB
MERWKRFLLLVAIMFVVLSIAWRNQSWEFHGVYLAALVTLAFVGFYVLARLAATWDQPKLTRKDFQEKLRFKPKRDL